MLNQILNLNEELFSAHSEKNSIRQGFGDALLFLGEIYNDLVVLTGDLAESVRVHMFEDKFPDRFIEVGIAEQNMAGIAAGLALSGKIPIITSFASFSPTINFGTIKMSICLSKANVKIVGSHGGLSAAADGATQQSLVDIGLMRLLPDMVVLAPCDYYQAQKSIEAAIKYEGPVYIRLEKGVNSVITTKDTPYEIGKALILKEGTDVTLLAYGSVLFNVLQAARELKLKHGINAEVINVHTIKPLDEKTILESIKKTGVALTIEEHKIAGGLGGAVAELLGEKLPTKLTRLGINDSFGESGTHKELQKKHGLDKDSIINSVKNTISDKSKFANSDDRR